MKNKYTEWFLKDNAMAAEHFRKEIGTIGNFLCCVLHDENKTEHLDTVWEDFLDKTLEKAVMEGELSTDIALEIIGITSFSKYLRYTLRSSMSIIPLAAGMDGFETAIESLCLAAV